MIRTPSIRMLLLSSAALLDGCTGKTPPPEISLDKPYEARCVVEPIGPVQVVKLPQPLPLSGKTGSAEPTDPKTRVTTANAAARVQPTRSGTGFRLGRRYRAMGDRRHHQRFRQRAAHAYAGQVDAPRP